MLKTKKTWWLSTLTCSILYTFFDKNFSDANTSDGAIKGEVITNQ